ncbi:MAG: glycosyltransferase, partial [Candidatus Bathyarchaeia archaeon]
MRRLKYPNYRIVVIDNGSTDGSIEKIKKWAAGNIRVSSKNFRDNYPVSDVKWIEYDRRIAERGGLRELEDEIEYLSSNRKIVLIRIGVNLGYAGGNNVGVKYAIMRGAKYLWLLNNDTVVDDDALTEMIRFSGNKTNGIVGCKLLYYDRPNVIQAAGGGRFYFWMGLSRHYGWLNRDDGRWNRIFRPHYVTGASMLIKNLCFNETGLFDET